MTISNKKQEEIVESRGKVFINFNQEEFKNEEGDTLWKMDTLQVSSKKNAIKELIEYLEKQQARPIRELTIDSSNEYAREKLNSLETQISELRERV